MEDILNNTQKFKAKIWFETHLMFISNIVESAEDEYPPIDVKDDPELWNPEHWRWFLHNRIYI